MLDRSVTWLAWFGVLGSACSQTPEAAAPSNAPAADAPAPSATVPAEGTAPSSATSPAGSTMPAEPAPVGAGVTPGPAGATCGGIAGLRCQDGLFCDYPPSAHCGAADQAGTCQPKPQMCTKIYKPVCGCDDKTHGNACDAHGAGVSIASEGECGKH